MTSGERAALKAVDAGVTIFVASDAAPNRGNIPKDAPCRIKAVGLSRRRAA